MLAAVQYKLDGGTEQVKREIDEAKHSGEGCVQKLLRKEVNNDLSELISYREL